MAEGRVIAVLRDRLLLSLLVERFVLTLINEDYYYYERISIENQRLINVNVNVNLKFIQRIVACADTLVR